MNAPINLRRPAARLRSAARLHPLSRIRYQLVIGLLLAVVLPALLYHMPDLMSAVRLRSSLNTWIGASVAYAIALYLYRRVATFPGFSLLGYVMPAVAGGYGIVL